MRQQTSTATLELQKGKRKNISFCIILGMKTDYCSAPGTGSHSACVIVASVLEVLLHDGGLVAAQNSTFFILFSRICGVVT
jgi:hypothetical protein